MRNESHMNYLRRKTADEAELWAADRIEALEAERDKAKNNAKTWHSTWQECFAALQSAEAERDELKADAMRLNWIDKALFQHQWNGVVGAGAKTYWRIAGDYRQTAAKMEGETFRDAIDAAIAKGDKHAQA